MRQTAEGRQACSHPLARHAERARQGAGRERIRLVVRTVDRQRRRSDDALRAFDEPAFAHAKIRRRRRRIESKSHYRATRERHAPGCTIVTIQHLHAIALEDARLGRPVFPDAGVAIEVILREIQHRRRARIERPSRLELVARELKHPGGGRRVSFQRRLEDRRRNIPGDLRVDARGLQQVTGERSHRALAVGAGDRKHRRAVLPREELDIAQHRQPARERLRYQRRFER